MRRFLTFVLAIGVSLVADADDQRARINYMLHCQGCHLADAEGYENEVPRIRNFVGYFLHSREGREFLVRVPGVATASLPDDQLAELMNWLLFTYSRHQLPDTFEPFSVDEVAALRTQIETSPQNTRVRILRNIARDLPALAVELGTPTSR